MTTRAPAVLTNLMRSGRHAGVDLLHADKGYVGEGGDPVGHVHIVDPAVLTEGLDNVIFG